MLTSDIPLKIKQWIAAPEHRYQALIWLCVGILYYPIFKLLYDARWESVDYTHAYFILPVAIFLGWHALKNARVSGLGTSTSSLKPDGTGSHAMPVPSFSPEFQVPDRKFQLTSLKSVFYSSLLVFSLLIFIFGWRQDYLFITTLSLIPLLYGLIGYLYGSKTLRILWFPIAYLLLLVPPPLGIIDSITLPMRYGVSIVTELLVKMFGYPITREGLLLSISGHNVFLGEACSGFRSLITLSSLGLAYIFISKGGMARKLCMTVSILPLSLLGNLIRVIGVVIVTYYLGETMGQKFFHDASGFVMFVIMIAGLLAVENFKMPGWRNRTTSK